MTIHLFKRGINGGKMNPQIIHDSSKLYCALACDGVREGFKQSKPDGNKKVLYNHEDSLQLVNLFLVGESPNKERVGKKS